MERRLERAERSRARLVEPESHIGASRLMIHTHYDFLKSAIRFLTACGRSYLSIVVYERP